jgi:hypothetical protein
MNVRVLKWLLEFSKGEMGDGEGVSQIKELARVTRVFSLY